MYIYYSTRDIDRYGVVIGDNEICTTQDDTITNPVENYILQNQYQYGVHMYMTLQNALQRIYQICVMD